MRSSDTVTYQVHTGVACLTLNYPPVNTLDLPVRTALSSHLETAVNDDRVTAIVIMGQGRHFCGGANLAAFETDGLAEPTLHRTINHQIESSHKPIVAAVHGSALGGGLELILSCHYRLWQTGTKIGLPEITLGFMPGAGGTQKLPRATGLETAINLILTGKVVNVESLQDTHLVDEIYPPDVDLQTAAIAFAHRVANLRPLPRLRDIKIHDLDDQATLQFARRTFAHGRKAYPGSSAALDAIAKTVDNTPFDAAMEYEFALFHDLAQLPPARALRYQFLAKSRAGKPDNTHDEKTPGIVRRAAIFGAGLMGTGIALCLAQAEIDVNLTDLNPTAQERAFAEINQYLASLIKKGKISEDSANEIRSRIHWTEGLQTLHNVDLALEAIVEDYDAKAALLRWLDQHTPTHAWLASNTSSLDLNHLAEQISHPERLVGLHFFSPAPLMPLVEVVRTRYAPSTLLNTALALCRRLKKTAVIAGVCDGFIGNRMVEQYTQQAIAMVAGGITPSRIDAALEKFGMAMGPFRMLDMVGNDIPWAGRLRRYAKNPELPKSLADTLCEQGWFGQKTGKGWYGYSPGQIRPIANPDLPWLVAEHGRQHGIQALEIDDETIIQRCLLALTNEGAKLLEEGIAKQASDIDVVYTLGYGFPAQKGGPMFYADELGLVNVIRLMHRFAKADPTNATQWQPAPLLVNCLAQNQKLHQANGDHT